MNVNDITATLAAKWKRQFVIFSVGPPDIFCMYAEEALTGFACIISEPKIEKFNNEACVLIPLSSWIMVKHLATDTVTPFRIVAKGKDIIEKAFRPHTGLLFPIRNTELGAAMLIPVKEFNKVK